MVHEQFVAHLMLQPEPLGRIQDVSFRPQKCFGDFEAPRCDGRGAEAWQMMGAKTFCLITEQLFEREDVSESEMQLERRVLSV